jgi:hypothetical protein
MMGLKGDYQHSPGRSGETYRDLLTHALYQHFSFFISVLGMTLPGL